ncbi:hormogonium polysaccharide biosynthesis protein HpsA [Leptolyngbya sp. AN03gr2]
MSNRKLSIQGFFQKLGRLYRKIKKSFVTRVLRYALFYQRRGKLSTAGFILPTTVLLILVVVLTVGALTFRAYNRNIQVIGEAQQRVIYNAATPAIDRARSKLEFLFDPTKDTRLPSGVPSQDILEAMLLNNGATRSGGTFAQLPYKDAQGNQTDAYTFPDESRVDLNKDGNPRNDNAWYFRTDTNGNGSIDNQDSTVVYSIVLNTPRPTAANRANNTPAQSIATRLLALSEEDKANNRWVRQAPLSVDGALGCATNAAGGNSGPEGWFEDKNSTAILRKNFQVDALVIPGSPNGTKATLEFTQDRQIDRGNKWGAWFRHDLEIYPGRSFNWNGAMHTEGSLILGDKNVRAYLISSTSSCLYPPPSNSEITVTNIDRGTATTNLLGLVAAGNVKNQNAESDKHSAVIDLHGSTPSTVNLTPDNDSSAASNPFAITIDPETILLENGYTTVPRIGTAANSDRNNRGANLDTANRELQAFGKNQSRPQRIDVNPAPAPYVDDLYRADDLWGPKPKYSDKEGGTVPTADFGKPIPSSSTELINNNVPPEDTEAAGVGLDGYWERRARVRGLRLLVGQRLELGNLFTWYAPTRSSATDNYVGYSGTAASSLDQDTYEYEGDPLYPPTVKPYPTASATERLSHVDLQRRTLRDNLSAVQSTAVYHASADDQKDYPIACLATTSHPGTLWTLRQAITFRPFEFSGTNSAGTINSTSLLTNFFTGTGTNGWEFEPPAGTYLDFERQINDATSPLRKALKNLANFAGDHQSINGTLKSGAFPPTPNDTVIHPFPALSMWGNYSNLKRALSSLERSGASFSTLSVADKTYLQTAACTLGMLAYNVDRIQKFDPSAISGTNAPNDKDLGGSGANKRRLMAKLGRDLWALMDGVNNPVETSGRTVNPEVLPKEQLRTYNYSAATATPDSSRYRPEDYERVPPEAFIAALRQYLLSQAGGGLKPDDPNFIEEIRLAETIMLHHQIRRDRTYGFKPSPSFGRYAVFPAGVLNPVSMATACDPDQFVFTPGTQGDAVLSTNMAGSFAEPTISRASTVLSSNSLTAVPLPANPNDYFEIFPRPQQPNVNGFGVALSQYRLALSRLCGTLDASGNQVLPKFPALYYLFPEVDHGYRGAAASVDGFDHEQPDNEPYTARYVAGDPNQDNYIGLINARFERIDTTRAAGRAGYPSPVFPAPSDPTAKAAYDELSRRPSSNAVFPVADLSVSSIALTPRPLNQWKLPYLNEPKAYDITTAGRGFRTSTSDSAGSVHTNDKANFSPNLILKDDLTPIAVPFLDRAFFDGRQLMLVRTLDIDLGMLRSTRLGATNDVWLPMSGIVYAFREDAVREDAISRPTCAASVTNCETNIQNPANPTDPRVRPANSTATTLSAGQNGISTKAIDPYPDPERRLHGFRLRNGVQLMRNRSFQGTSGFINEADNSKGLSFFTDQPVYIQGNFNLHQDGNDDTMGTILEEFRTPLADNYSNFYTRSDTNLDFAKPERDRWRPSEILADSITILSNGFCDGSIADTFLQYRGTEITQGLGTTATSRYPVPDADVLTVATDTGDPNIRGASSNRSYYHNPAEGLFDPGCAGIPNRTTNYTSFHNQNRPARSLNTKTAGTRSGWDWVRENSRYDAVANRRPDTLDTANFGIATGHWVDMTAPVKISRSGHPLVVRPRDTTTAVGDAARSEPLPPIPYNIALRQSAATPRVYYNYGTNITNGVNASFGNVDHRFETLVRSLATRVNSIIVSGISPSRPQQGYGGLHNFPRFIERWEIDNNNPIPLNFLGSFIQLSYTNYATAPFELEDLEPGANSSPRQTDPAQENIIYYDPPARRWGYDVALQYSPASPAAARFVTASKNRSEYYVEPPANDPYIANLCEAAKTALSLNTNCPRRGGS